MLSFIEYIYSFIPVSLSVPFAVIWIFVSSAVKLCIVTVGFIVSFIVVVAWSPWLFPSVSLAYTVVLCGMFGIVPLFAISVQFPSVVVLN